MTYNGKINHFPAHRQNVIN